jgi:hypothetical protein
MDIILKQSRTAFDVSNDTFSVRNSRWLKVDIIRVITEGVF